ncbi:MAG: o-succinylbenzoate synthase [Myxococcales bacterium]
MIRFDRLWRHRGTLSRPAANAKARWLAREALVVELVDETGVRGQGEAAPLEGYSPDSLEDAERALAALLGRELGDSIRGALPPSARCALETARLDLVSRQSGRSLPAALGAPASAQVAVCASLSHGSIEAQLADAARAWSQGFRTFKVKIGGPSVWPQELELLAELRRRHGGQLRLRVDANGALDPAGLPAALAALEPFDLELIEEPVTGPAWGRIEESRVPLAADESLQAPGPEVLDAFRRGVIRVAVLKPTTLGGPLSCLALARQLSELGARFVVGHAFEGPLSLAASAALALALAAPGTSELASGLDRHVGLSAWPPVDLPFPAGPALRSWTAPGLGLTLPSP